MKIKRLLFIPSIGCKSMVKKIGEVFSFSIILLLFSVHCWGSVDCDGTDDFFNATAAAAVEPVSIACWFKADTVSIVQTIFSFGFNSDEYFRLFLFNDDVGMQTQNGAGAFSRTASTIGIGEWHLAAGVTANNASRKSYLDGEEEATNTTSVTTAGTMDTVGICRNEGTTVPEYFNGEISECGIWNVVLTQNEIRIIANSKIKGMMRQIRTASLIGHWFLDAGPDGSSYDGVIIRDQSSNSNAMTGDDGAGNTGLTAKAEVFLSYP